MLVADHRIELLDPDTFDSEVLVDLEGADGYLSATAVENDLVFVADARIWLIEDVFTFD